MSKFTFKQFDILQDKTAMKVNTDGVLLGAWIEKDFSQNILDIGTGTGVIAIMLAQKFSSANITGIEIEQEAAEQAKINAQNCKWSERITILHSDFLEFANNAITKFDLIVSNPPFFENQLNSTDYKKNIARHTTKLPFENLIRKVKNILSTKGKFCVIIPETEFSGFNHLCNNSGLFLAKKTNVFPKENKPANRLLLEYSQEIVSVNENSLYIRKTTEYTEEYLRLTADYYLFA